ncbi:EAL domain-containing protein [uncultured Abyssibacter sp.]|uniref:putative bifunctional diguanylate cyclase/phosphodiesterase n=1 Tax=uncultured Abyssibacter sp. TaxID=2320202 RepID=UPI0032B13E7E
MTTQGPPRQHRLHSARARLRTAQKYTLLAFCVLCGVQSLVVFKLLADDLEDAAQVQANMLAAVAAHAVADHDAGAVRAHLKNLPHQLSTIAAEVRSDAHTLAAFGPPITESGAKRRWTTLTVTSPIQRDATVIGTAVVQVSIQAVWLRLAIFAGLTALVCLVALATVSVFAGRLAHAIDAASQQLRQLAKIDPLTGLPNRRAFNDLLQALTREDDQRTLVAVIDIDNFKDINDGLGHGVGDHLLKQLGERFTRETALGAEVRIFRLGGDEFGLIATLSARAGSGEHLLQDVQRVLATPIRIGGRRFQLAVSIGACVTPDDGRDPDELFRKADTAMYEIKRNGKNSYCLYNPGLEREHQERYELIRDLREAITRGELSVAYQPIVNLRSGQIDGAEALLRWRHPGRGWVSPGVFIPLAEEAGLIQSIGHWVLMEVCRQITDWTDHGEPPLTVSVNLSVKHLLEPDFVRQLQKALTETGVPPSQLKLEITESVLGESFDAVAARLSHIRTMGVRLSVDDFGTGYSSLAYLPAFPVQEVKIDKSFVSRLPGDGAPIVDAIMRLAESFGLQVVAEGVETRTHLDWIREAGCARAQGFLFSPAVPPNEFVAFRNRFRMAAFLPSEPALRAVSSPRDQQG